jgi:hypothetical protein
MKAKIIVMPKRTVLDPQGKTVKQKRNVFGLMPHPERASEELLGSDDGRVIFESILAGAAVR